MRRRPLGWLVAAAAAIGLTAGVVAVVFPAAPAQAAGNWIGSWEAAPGAAAAPAEFTGIAVRNVLHLSVGGNAVRVHLSNAFGDKPLHIDDATVAVAAGRTTPRALIGTVRALTFDGSRRPTIPAGGELVSDPVRLRVDAGDTVLISTYTADPEPLTLHSDAQQMSFTAVGDHTTDESGRAFTGTVRHWYVVDGVDVRQSRGRGSVVAFGDSITDGYQSTAGTDRRWPDDLGRRLAPLRMGVLNAGISGNRLLQDGAPAGGSGPSALRRFDRDVLSRTDVRTVILLEGVNDIMLSPQQTDPTRIEAGLRQLADRARAAGMWVVGGTLTPFADSVHARPELEAVRTAVNTWIRHTGAFDAVIDFDRAVRDPGQPDRLRRSYDSGDHLHPSDAGYQAMSDAVSLAAIQRPEDLSK